MESKDKFKWRKQDYFWLISFILVLSYLMATVRLSDNADVVNIISLIASAVSIALAIVAIYWGQVNNSEANKIYDKMNDKLEQVINVTTVINNSVDEVKESIKYEGFGKFVRNTEESYINTRRKSRESELEVLNEIRHRFDYLDSKISDTSSDEIVFGFNRDLSSIEFEKFIQLFNESDIPLDTADMKDNYAGIYIHLEEKISGYEIYRAKEKMNKLLKEINPDLEVEE